MRRVKKKQVKDNSQIAYTGNVTIKVVRNDEVVKVINGHNAGMTRLFEYIAKCLIGLYESTYAPKYIQCFHATSESPDLSNLDSLVGIIPISSSTYTTVGNTCSAKLTFTIPGDLFTSDEEVNFFALYNYKEYENKANPMATYYSDSALTNIDKNSNVIIVWELQIGNATN